MVMLIKGHLDVKTNKFTKMSMCVAVFCSEYCNDIRYAKFMQSYMTRYIRSLKSMRKCMIKTEGRTQHKIR